MTIDEAIRRLADQIDLLTKDRDYPTEVALKLGIEALREVKRLRSYKAFHIVKVLPEETEE